MSQKLLVFILNLNVNIVRPLNALILMFLMFKTAEVLLNINISITILIFIYFDNHLFASRLRHPRRHKVIALFVNVDFSDEDI